MRVFFKSDTQHRMNDKTKTKAKHESKNEKRRENPIEFE